MSSFLDDILDVGGKLWQSFTGPGTGAAVARATALALLLRQVTNSINKENQRPDTARSERPDEGVREQVNPDPEHAIPIVYGSAFLGGIVTDAVLTNNNQTMFYCITICEKTGTLINGSPSEISVEEIYWNENRLLLKNDGITAASYIDEDGVTVTDIDGLVRFYFYSGGSNSPVNHGRYNTGNTLPAYNLFPGWTSNHTMEGLVFCIVRVDYNKEKSITGLDNLEFKIKNTMSLPGDVLYDYMTNTKYGAGIPAEEINSL
jgi:hypothetical protein